jgi:hypothetical protein
VQIHSTTVIRGASIRQQILPFFSPPISFVEFGERNQ